MALVVLVGYGQWTSDSCLTDSRFAGAREGSTIRTSVEAWPPGAVTCRVAYGGSEVTAWTIVPWFAYVVALAALVAAGFWVLNRRRRRPGGRAA